MLAIREHFSETSDSFLGVKKCSLCGLPLENLSVLTVTRLKVFNYALFNPYYLVLPTMILN